MHSCAHSYMYLQVRGFPNSKFKKFKQEDEAVQLVTARAKKKSQSVERNLGVPDHPKGIESVLDELACITPQDVVMYTDGGCIDNHDVKSKNPPGICLSCEYVHTYIHTCIHAYINTYIHKYIHTYIHT